jgi:hypothetical protein
MEAIIGLFLFGTIWFWLFWAVATVVIICSLETEHFMWGNMFAFVGALLIYLSFSHIAPGVLTLGNIGIAVGLYLAAGGIWSLFKWWRHCRQELEATKEKIAHQPDRFDYHQSDLRNQVSASQNKGRICAWITYWPWSCFWNISRDAINTVFDALTGLYNGISNHTLNQLEKPKK